MFSEWEEYEIMRDLTSTEELSPDPLIEFSYWLEDAKVAKMPRHDSIVLPVATPDSMPWARVVYMRRFDEDGCFIPITRAIRDKK